MVLDVGTGDYLQTYVSGLQGGRRSSSISGGRRTSVSATVRHLVVTLGGGDFLSKLKTVEIRGSLEIHPRR